MNDDPLEQTIDELIPAEDDAEQQLWQNHEWSSQHVIFVSEVLRTNDDTRAYRKAFAGECDGVSGPSIWGRVNRLWKKNPALAAYVKFVRRKMAERLTVNKDTILAELAKLGRSNFSDFVILDEDGNPSYDLSGLNHDQFAAIQEMTIDTYYEREQDGVNKGQIKGEVRSVKVKLAPKLGALELLGKHYKMFTDVVESRDAVDLSDELRRARQERRKRNGQQSDDDGPEAGQDGGNAQESGDNRD